MGNPKSGLSPERARRRASMNQIARAVTSKVGVVPARGHRSFVVARARGRRFAVVTKSSQDPKDVGGAVGRFISSLTEFAANSPINQGKIALAKAQAGDYDVEATKAELQEIIDGSKVVMFSFTT